MTDHIRKATTLIRERIVEIETEQSRLQRGLRSLTREGRPRSAKSKSGGAKTPP